jgi:GntR family transcriptional regulator
VLHLGQVDREDDKPPYRQIADLLRRPISTGQWAGGDRLPSETALVHHFGVARMTVRQAVQQLRAEGLVVSEHGRGVFVRAASPVRRLASDRFVRQRLHPPGTDAVVEAGKAENTPTVDRVTATREKPNPVVAQRLGLTSDDDVVVRSWRCLADGRPIATAVSYIPATVAHNPTTEQPAGPGGIYTQLADAGHTVERFTEEVGARMPTPEERRTLTVPPGVPVLTVLRTAYRSDGGAVEVRDMLKVASAYLLEYDYPTR